MESFNTDKWISLCAALFFLIAGTISFKLENRKPSKLISSWDDIIYSWWGGIIIVVFVFTPLMVAFIYFLVFLFWFGQVLIIPDAGSFSDFLRGN